MFKDAEQGKHQFALADGLDDPAEDEIPGFIYSRMGNPALELLESCLALYEKADRCLVFASGMAAITTTLMTYLRPGQVLLYSGPVYGGTDHFIKHTLSRFGVRAVEFDVNATRSQIVELLDAQDAPLGMIFLETPTNPTNVLFDIEMCAEIAAERSSEDNRVLVAVDNTFLGPLWQKPLQHGADLVLYSASKYISGHNDVIAGACIGATDLLNPLAMQREVTGTMADPWTGWLVMRSLETLHMRMVRHSENAKRVAGFLNDHPKIDSVNYLGLLTPGTRQYEVYRRQCDGPGAMISFDVLSDEKGVFRFLNALSLVKLAVSLGGTESLAQDPDTMTHAAVDPNDKKALGITEGLVRLSVGIEDPEDLVRDLHTALEAV